MKKLAKRNDLGFNTIEAYAKKCSACPSCSSCVKVFWFITSKTTSKNAAKDMVSLRGY